MSVNSQEIYSEVYSILNLLGDSYISKLPNSLLKMIKEEKSNTYNPQYNENQSLNEQNIKKESLSMIALFHLNYWCNSQEEKEELEQLFKANEEKYQAELREKYNPDNIFQNNSQPIIQQSEPIPQQQGLVEVKQGFFAKFVNRIKEIFRLK